MRTFALLAASGLIASSATGTVLFSEDFESYNSNADLTAAGWVVSSPALLVSPGDLLALETDENGTTSALLSSKGLEHVGGAQTIFTLASPAAVSTAASNIGLRMSYKALDDGTANKRMILEMRGDGLLTWAGAGRHNEADAQEAAVRLVFWPGGFVTAPAAASQYDAISGTVGVGGGENDVPEGYNEYMMEFTTTGITASVDLGDDGSVDFTEEFVFAAGPLDYDFRDIRLGGPSGVSSAGGGVVFDDIVLETFIVPEPASAALLGLGAALVGRRRRA